MAGLKPWPSLQAFTFLHFYISPWFSGFLKAAFSVAFKLVYLMQLAGLMKLKFWRQNHNNQRIAYKVPNGNESAALNFFFNK